MTKNTALNTSKPLWSFKTLFISFLVIVGIATTIVLIISHNELWLELEMVLGIIAIVMFHFYWWVLYHGVEFTDDDHFKLSFTSYDVADPGLPTGDLVTVGADDLVSFLVLIALEIGLYLILALGLSALFWMGINGFVLAIALVTAPLFFVFRSSIKFVLRNSPRCHGHFFMSAVFSALFTILKTTLVGLAIFGAHYLALLYK